MLYFPFWTSTVCFPCFPFFIDRTWKQVLSIQTIYPWSIIGQLNVKVAATENEEQCTLINIICIGFQNPFSFLWSFFDKQFLKSRQISWKIFEVEFIFWQSYSWRPATLPEKYSFKHSRKISPGFCKVFKIFISTKLYTQDRKLGAKKTRRIGERIQL